MATAQPPPTAGVLMRAYDLSIKEDKPVCYDYYVESCEKTCCIGVNETIKYLVKSDKEYTSPIQEIFKCDSCYLISTENSIYVVSREIPVKKIVSSTHNDE
jgi:hypothetical protein